MSRDIDFSKPLDADEERYVRERPWMMQEAAQAGHEVIFESDAVTREATPAPRSTPAKAEAPAAQQSEDEDAEDEDIETDEDEDEVEDYSDTTTWTKKALQAEIDRRNEEYDEDEQIVPEGKNRDDLVAALLADDEALLAEDDEDED